MTITDERLKELRVENERRKAAGLVSLYPNELDMILNEIEQYRKVYGVLSADDLLNGATAFEELKHGVEEAIKEIKLKRAAVYGNWEEEVGYVNSIGFIKKHVSEYLED